MTRLVDLQRLFWRSVRYDKTPPEMHREVASTGLLSADERVDIYRRMYWYRQVDALHESFPILANLLGEQAFTRLACRYITAHASEHPMLERLGRHLADFMRTDPEGCSANMQTLWADVAEIEWTQTKSLLSPDPVRVMRMQDVPFEQFPRARLALAPSVFTCRVRPEALGLVRRASPAASRLSPSALAACTAPQQGGAENVRDRQRTVLVFRPDFFVRERLLDHDEADALARIAGGETLAEVLLAFEGHDEPARRGMTCIMLWFADELITDITIAEGPS